MYSHARLRAPEWALLWFFVYVAIVAPFFPDRPHLHYQPLATLLSVFLLLFWCAFFDRGVWEFAFTRIRDWLPIILTLVAFREMEFFLPPHYNYGYEVGWIPWDTLLLEHWHLRDIIESLGTLIPGYLEFCYFFVYGIASYCVAVLWFRNERRGIDSFLTIYLTGTLCAYALFPYFPSLPPRYAYPEVAAPHISTWWRQLNLVVLNKGTIHVGVFPSAHVSSAFSAAFGMFLAYPQRRRYGWGLLIYAASVALATVYGRYHYVVDVVAGFGVSLLAGLVALLLHVRAARSAHEAAVAEDVTDTRSAH